MTDLLPFSGSRRLLLINPTITSRRGARFPLAILSLSAALDGKYPTLLLDGNVDRDFVSSALRLVEDGQADAVALTVMGGPQLRSAIAASRAIRARSPRTPIIWGGAFPTNCPDAALRSPYVDYVVRGQGEETRDQLLGALSRADSDALPSIGGLSWRRGEEIVHNKARPFSAGSHAARLPYERLANPAQYLPATYLGRHTAGY